MNDPLKFEDFEMVINVTEGYEKFVDRNVFLTDAFISFINLFRKDSVGDGVLHIDEYRFTEDGMQLKLSIPPMVSDIFSQIRQNKLDGDVGKLIDDSMEYIKITFILMERYLVRYMVDSGIIDKESKDLNSLVVLSFSKYVTEYLLKDYDKEIEKNGYINPEDVLFDSHKFDHFLKQEMLNKGN